MSSEIYRPLERSLCLVGLMGSGKSAVGELLAKRGNFPFYDSDQEIEKKCGKTIPEIFKEAGEGEFRRIETEVILDLLNRVPGIISIGGGAFVQNSIREALLSQATCIYLKATPETLYERVKAFSHRPLLQKGDPLGTLKRLLHDREPYYSQAPYVVETKGMSVDAVVEMIYKARINPNKEGSLQSRKG